MRLGYIIIYVPDIAEAMSFFSRAFGLKAKIIHESGEYGELDTGQTTLAFASHSLGETNLPSGYVGPDSSDKPLGVEIALITESVEIAHADAIRCGAAELVAPATKPWGQVVSYVRSPEGILIELCSPIDT